MSSFVFLSCTQKFSILKRKELKKFSKLMSLFLLSYPKIQGKMPIFHIFSMGGGGIPPFSLIGHWGYVLWEFKLYTTLRSSLGYMSISQKIRVKTWSWNLLQVGPYLRWQWSFKNSLSNFSTVFHLYLDFLKAFFLFLNWNVEFVLIVRLYRLSLAKPFF